MVSWIKLAVVYPFAERGGIFRGRPRIYTAFRGEREGFTMKKRLLCFLLAAALMLGMVTGLAGSAHAATRQEKTRAIAIVFDNSGSMYGYGNYNWCRATYATEVFAAMMNDGDQMLIYPMNTIRLGRTGNYVNAPLVINGPGEASVVREIFTPNEGGGTPFDTVTQAYKGLQGVSADEKYLVVITDGAFLNGSIPGSQVSEYLDDYAKSMNIMFLGIGIDDYYMPTEHDRAKQYYAKASTSDEVLYKLTDMCNRIFGRDELKAANNQITFDVSMSKIIVFVQGQGIEKVSLDGGIKVSEHATKYSELHTYYDPDLQGMLVTYTDLDAGTYNISYTGDADNISVYYEPDVDLSIRLVDQDGVVHNTGDDLPAGTYRLEYGLVDKYGNPTTSDLLGDQYYEISYTIDGSETTITDDKSGSTEITLEAGQILDGEFTAQYLTDYTITKDGDSLGWPHDGWEVIPNSLGDITLQVTGGADNYNLSTLEQDAVYDVAVLYEGVPLTGDELKNTMLDVSLTGGNAEAKLTMDDDSYIVTVHYNGDAPNTDCGEYTLSLTASYTLYEITEQSSTVTKPFTLTDNSTALGMALEVLQDYYEIPKLAEAQPLYLNLTMGGLPMDSDQLTAALVNIDIPGVEFDLEADTANSRYIITLKPGEIEAGKRTVTATVSCFDEIGRAVTAEDTASIELQNYPAWLRILFYILIGLLVLLLIWLYLNTKILPKHIGLGACTFIVDGELVSGSAKCTYTGKNKRRGTLTVQSPHYGANPAAKCGFTLELEAISPRRVRSSARSVQVVGVRPMSASSTIAVQVGGCNLSKDPISGKLMKAGGKPGAPLSFKVGNKAKTSVTAEVMDMANGGGEITVSMSVPLKFF